jgi:methylmalonyl-CoA mutase N-terminal domain/subunit
MDEHGQARQLERLAEVKRSRSPTEVRAALDALGRAAGAEDVNLMPLLVDCAKAYCTVGEMVDVLKDKWGEFQQPAVF